MGHIPGVQYEDITYNNSGLRSIDFEEQYERPRQFDIHQDAI